MAKTEFSYQNPRDVIVASDLNSTFVNIEDNLDGTSGKVDGDNLRTEAINRAHVDPSGAEPTKVGKNETNSSTTLTATTFTTICTVSYSATIKAGEALRMEANPMSELTVAPTTNNSLTRASALYYFQWFVTIGGVDTAVSPSFGYGLIPAGRGDIGTLNRTVPYFWRHLTSTVWIPATNTAITAIKLKAKLNTDTTGASIDFNYRHIYYFHARY